MNFKESLDQLKDKIDVYLNKYMNQEIDKIQGQHPFLTELYKKMGNYIGKGKRFRGALLASVYRGLTGDNSEKILRPAIGLELIQAYLLAHDDLMDKSVTRRGEPTIHKYFEQWYLDNVKDDKKEAKDFGESAGILAGDIFNHLAVDCLRGSDFPIEKRDKLVDICNKTCKITGDGQAFDLMSPYDTPTEENYMNNINGKTVEYTGLLPIRAACVLGDAKPEQKDLLEKYIVPTIKAFQIYDDIIDCFSPDLDKTPGADIREGKKTLLVVKAFEKVTEEQKQTLESILGKRDATSGEIEIIKDIFIETGALDECKKITEELILEGKEYLKDIELGKETIEFLDGFGNYMIARKH